MDRYVAVFRDEEGIKTGARDRQAAQGGGRERLHRRPRRVFNQDVLGALELGYMLDNAEAPASAPCTAPRAAAPSTAPTSPTETTTSG